MNMATIEIRTMFLIAQRNRKKTRNCCDDCVAQARAIYPTYHSDICFEDDLWFGHLNKIIKLLKVPLVTRLLFWLVIKMDRHVEKTRANKTDLAKLSYDP